MTTKIYFVRHGESMGNVDESCYRDDNCNFLTGFGVKQAQLCGEYFRRRGLVFDTVISSGLTRARHTTSTILQEMNLPIFMWDVRYGLNEVNHHSEQQRVIETYTKISQSVLDKDVTILIVSHYHTMQVIWEKCMNLLAENVPGEGKIIRNATPFMWESSNPTKLKLIELNDIRYNIRND